ncbi:MAG: hypothetical protein JWP76_2204 [Dactylosporangium sp.]|nr:hypothetical protein [Dactylosporangium sp.]
MGPLHPQEPAGNPPRRVWHQDMQKLIRRQLTKPVPDQCRYTRDLGIWSQIQRCREPLQFEGDVSRESRIQAGKESLPSRPPQLEANFLVIESGRESLSAGK